MTAELARLRADMEVLQAAQRSAAHSEPIPEPKPPRAEAPGPVDNGNQNEPAPDPDSKSLQSELAEQVEELGDLLQEEIKNMPALTSLTVFTLGILLGRFLR